MTVPYSVATGDTVQAADVNQYKKLLEGETGYTTTFALKSTAATNFVITLGDASGTNKISIKDSGGVEVAYIDSDGNFSGNVSLAGGALILPQSATPAQTAEGSIVWDTDGNFITVGDSSSRKSFYPSAEADTWVTVTKAANETVNTSATAQNDDDFAFTVSANTDYLIEASLFLSSDSTADFKFTWTLTNMTWDGLYPNATGNYAESTAAAIASAAEKAIQIGATGSQPVRATFLIHSGSTGGTLNFQWAQNTSNASDTKILKYSSMRWKSLGAT